MKFGKACMILGAALVVSGCTEGSLSQTDANTPDKEITVLGTNLVKSVVRAEQEYPDPLERAAVGSEFVNIYTYRNPVQ